LIVGTIEDKTTPVDDVEIIDPEPITPEESPQPTEATTEQDSVDSTAETPEPEKVK
jgi:hypothetical protein